jgi:hypothetical protein
MLKLQEILLEEKKLYENDDDSSEVSKEKLDALAAIDKKIDSADVSSDEDAKLPETPKIEQTFEFNVDGEYLLQNAIKTIKKMSKKFRVPEPEIIVGKPFKKGIGWNDVWGSYDYYVNLIPVKLIVKEIFKLPDYKVLAVVDNMTEGAVIFGDEKVPNELLTSSQECDLCKTNRRRGKSWIVKKISTGEYQRFGGDCVKKAFGINPMKFLAAIDFFQSLKTTISEDYGDDFRGGVGKRISEKLKVVPFPIALTIIKNVYDKIGYVKKEYEYVSIGYGWSAREDKVQSNKGETTGEKAQEIMLNFDVAKQIKPDDEFVKAFENYWENYNITNPESDFGKFLIKIKNFIKEKQFRILDSGMMAFAVHQYQTKKNEVEKKPSEFVGTVGEKMVFEKLKLTSYRTFESAYGTSGLYNFEDQNGNKLTKFGTISSDFYVGSENGENKREKMGEPDFSNNYRPEKGDLFSFMSSIKKHEVYNGTKQTILDRATKLPKPPKTKKLAEDFNKLVNYQYYSSK